MNHGNQELLRPSGKILEIWIGPGLPSTTRPSKATTPASGRQRIIGPNKPPRLHNDPRGLLTFPPPPPSEDLPLPIRGVNPARAQNFPVTHHQDARTQTNQTVVRSDRRETERPKKKKPTPPRLPKVKALYDYTPQDLDELQLREGDVIELLKEHEGGWWHGRLNGKAGLFPSNYVERVWKHATRPRTIIIFPNRIHFRGVLAVNATNELIEELSGKISLSSIKFPTDKDAAILARIIIISLIRLVPIHKNTYNDALCTRRRIFCTMLVEMKRSLSWNSPHILYCIICT